MYKCNDKCYFRYRKPVKLETMYKRLYEISYFKISEIRYFKIRIQSKIFKIISDIEKDIYNKTYDLCKFIDYLEDLDNYSYGIISKVLLSNHDSISIITQGTNIMCGGNKWYSLLSYKNFNKNFIPKYSEELMNTCLRILNEKIGNWTIEEVYILRYLYPLEGTDVSIRLNCKKDIDVSKAITLLRFDKLIYEIHVINKIEGSYKIISSRPYVKKSIENDLLEYLNTIHFKKSNITKQNNTQNIEYLKLKENQIKLKENQIKQNNRFKVQNKKKEIYRPILKEDDYILSKDRKRILNNGYDVFFNQMNCYLHDIEYNEMLDSFGLNPYIETHDNYIIEKGSVKLIELY